MKDHPDRIKQVLEQVDSNLKKVKHFRLGVNHYGREVIIEKYSVVD